MSYVSEREFLWQVKRLAEKHLQLERPQVRIEYSTYANEDGSHGLTVVTPYEKVGPIHVWIQHVKTAEDWKGMIESLTDIFISARKWREATQ